MTEAQHRALRTRERFLHAAALVTLAALFGAGFVLFLP